MSAWRNYGACQAKGSALSEERARRLFNQILNEFEASPIDPAINEEFLEFAALRKSEGCCQLTFKVTV